MTDFIENYRSDSLQTFRKYKKLAEKAIEQVSDEEFFALIDDEANSIAVVVKHVAGNLHSRWTDFLTSDGEKPGRDRDTEFVTDSDTRASLMNFWETGWQTLFDNVEPLTVEDLSKAITIRGESHSVVEAINRQLTHYAYHIGQIVLLAKHFRSANWESLSVPRNRSKAFNNFMQSQQTAGTAALTRDDAVNAFSELEKEKTGQ